MVIIIAIAAAAVSALAQVGTHLYAWDRRWTRVKRYTVGVAIANAAITAALWLALPAEYALIATGLLWSTYVADGLAVGACYDERDRRLRRAPADTTPDATRLLNQLDRELTDDEPTDLS